MTLVPTTPTSPNEVEAQWKLAQRLCNTEFVPQAFRGKPENILAAILTGHEHGIGPMQALQSINVIQGKPTLAPELMRALVARAGHRVDTLEYTESIVTLKGTRSDTGAISEVSWTMDDAKRANLTGKGAWKTYPRSMLLARATAELCRLMFPDIIAGLSYTEEELGGEPAVVQVAPTPTVAEAPPLPNEIKVDALPPAPAEPSEEQGSGSTVSSPPAPVPGPAPDFDNADAEPAEAEIVTEDAAAPEPTGEGADTAVVASPDDAGSVEQAEGSPGGSQGPPPSTPDDTTWSPAKWREEAKAKGITQKALILAARDVAAQKSLDTVPSKLADLIDPAISPELRVWLSLQGA